ncbi:hypothetical protein BH24ACT5_BH24ACT5_20120 [soil metagenome]
MSTPKSPPGAGPSGRRLWRSILTDFELAECELQLLRELTRVVDRLDGLAAILDTDGLVVAGGAAGPKAHPALVEARQLAITQARLTKALRVPLGDEKDVRRPPRRPGARGVYNPAGGAA